MSKYEEKMFWKQSYVGAYWPKSNYPHQNDLGSGLIFKSPELKKLFDEGKKRGKILGIRIDDDSLELIIRENKRK